MKKIIFAICLSGTAFMFNACNEADSSKDPVEAAKDTNEVKEDKKVMAIDEADSKFLVFAADAGMTEVQAAELAKTQNLSPKAKEFADMMIKDHTAAGNEVKSLASQKNVTLPAGVGEDHQKSLADLGEKKGKDFEKAYIDMMVDDHQKVVDKFKDAAENCKDAEIKSFASKTLPALQGHLDHAKKMKEASK